MALSKEEGARRKRQRSIEKSAAELSAGRIASMEAGATNAIEIARALLSNISIAISGLEATIHESEEILETEIAVLRQLAAGGAVDAPPASVSEPD